MVAPRTIRCRVITVDVHGGAFPAHDRPTQAESGAAPATRPSELVPWADPYIAGLVRKLQAEVKVSVASAQRARPTGRLGAPVADLEWPWDGGCDEEPTELEPVGAPAGGESWNAGEQVAW